MYKVLKIAKSFRVCSSRSKNNIFQAEKSVFARFIFFVVVVLFPSTFSLRTGYLFVRLTEPGKSLSTAFEKSTIVSVRDLENKTIASQESEKIS